MTSVLSEFIAQICHWTALAGGSWDNEAMYTPMDIRARSRIFLPRGELPFVCVCEEGRARGEREVEAETYFVYETGQRCAL